MKYIWQLLAVVLFAAVGAATYELLVVRDGYVRIPDPISEIVESKGGIVGLLAGVESYGENAEQTPTPEGTPSPYQGTLEQDSNKKSRFSLIFPKRGYGVDGVVETELLVDEYTQGKLTDDEVSMFVDEGNQEYIVLEYCDHGSQLCQDAFGIDMDNVLIESLAGDEGYEVGYIRKPFVGQISSVVTDIWQADTCLDENKKRFLHTRMYAIAIDQGEISSEDVYGTFLGLGGDAYDDCYNVYSSQFRILQEMKDARDVFGVSRIPSYVVIDTRSNEWVLIPGLYDVDEVRELVGK